MAGFKTHIGTSTVVGVGYGAAGSYFGAPLADCILAGTLCSVAGILPDLDSDSGRPIRETFAFLAAIVPMMLIDRFRQLGLPHEGMVVAGILVYLIVRFGIAALFARYTVHRGMWHSLPAAAIAGLLAFILCRCDELDLRIYRSVAVVVGFLTHLTLDEIWSIEIRRGKLRLKKSFGTALKLWSGRSLWANVSTYGKLIVVLAVAITDPVLTAHYLPQDQAKVHTARSFWDQNVWGDKVRPEPIDQDKDL